MSAAKEAPPAEEAAPRKRGGLVRWLAMALIPLVGGSLGYFAQVLFHPSGASPGHAADHAEGTTHGEGHGAEHPPVLLPEPKIQTPELHEIDELLASGDYQQARKLFQEGKSGLAGPLPADLRARYALCAELYGDFKLALDIYRELAGEVEDPNLQRFAKVSQARLLYSQGEYSQSEALLCELVLTTLEGSSPREQEAIWHLWSHLSSDRLQSFDADKDLLSTSALARGSRDWFRPLLFPELTAPQHEGSNPGPTEDVQFENWATDPSLAKAEGKVQTRQVEISRVLDGLTNTLHLTAHYSPMAREILRGRTLHIRVASIRANALLDALLAPLDLSWWQTDSGELHVAANKELPQATRTAQQEERAERLAMHAVTQFASSTGTPFTKFKLANLAFIRGRLDGATAQYRQLINERPPVVVRQASWFNLAKAQYLSSEWDGAREAFLHVVDESRGHPLEAIAYLWLARIEQESLAFEKAEGHLVRALALSKDEESKLTATIAMASNLLLMGKASAAAITLQESREALLKSERHRPAAALLSALARKETPSRDQNTPLSGRLLAGAIIQAKPSDFLGYVGYSLLTRGYRLLGLSEQELATLEDAVAKVPVNPMHFDLRMELVQKQIARQMDDKALPHLQFLLEKGPDLYRFRAQFMMAQMTFRASEFEECAGQLRKLLESKVPSELRDEALALLGKTYSRLGQHYEAAMCFAGLLPGAQEKPVSIKGARP